MAKRLNTLNVVYTTVGLAVTAGVAYYAWCALRNRSARADQGAYESTLANATKDNLMDIRRATRKAGRAVQDTVAQVGKSVRRGAKDTAEAFRDGSSSGEALIEQGSTGSSASNH